jgi:hypothetical protein
MRTTSLSLGRARAANSVEESLMPVLHTAAMSASRRKRAASTRSAALDDGEPLAATRATRREHAPAAGRLHPRTKSVHTRSAACLWLIGALQDRVPSPAGTTQQEAAVCAGEHSSSASDTRWGIVRGLPRASDLSGLPFGVAVTAH